MESLANLSNKKTKEFYECFATFFSEEGKHYILDNFSLSFIEHSKNGLTIHEGGNLDIADILSLNENTVRTRISRARQLLKKYLGKEADNYEF